MNTWLQTRNALALLVLSVFVAACGTGRTMVVQPTAEARKFDSVTLERAADTVVVPEEFRALFVKELREELYGTAEKPGPFTEGPGLKIRVTVVQFDQGSQFQRWFWGGIGNAGEGSLHVLAEFFDGEMKLSQIQSEGRIGSGFFGGSMNEAVEKAADEIAKYAATNFH
jgi:hypothetical protein